LFRQTSAPSAGGTPRLALIDGFIGSVEYRARFLP
jgi:hypothetical protein